MNVCGVWGVKQILMVAAGCSTDCVRHAAASGAIRPTVAFLICGATNGHYAYALRIVNTNPNAYSARRDGGTKRGITSVVVCTRAILARKRHHLR